MRGIPEAERIKAQRAVVRYKLRMAAPYMIFTLIGVLFSTLAVVLTVSRSRQHDADFAKASLQAGTATVSSKTFTYTKAGVFMNFQFVFNGQRVSRQTENNERSIFTNTGDTVAITYRVGESGAYDLVDWQAPPRKVSLSH